MKKFEHKADVNTDIFSARIGGSLEEKYLKDWGDDGWELASILPVFNGQGTAYYWKREVTESVNAVVVPIKKNRNFDFIKKGAKVWMPSQILIPVKCEVISVKAETFMAEVKTQYEQGMTPFETLYETEAECPSR